MLNAKQEQEIINENIRWCDQAAKALDRDNRKLLTALAKDAKETRRYQRRFIIRKKAQ